MWIHAYVILEHFKAKYFAVLVILRFYVPVSLWACAVNSYYLYFTDLYSSANAVHFQAYLLEGIYRWNAARASDALSDIKLLDAVNKISGKLLTQPLNVKYRLPAQFNGELFKSWVSTRPV